MAEHCKLNLNRIIGIFQAMQEFVGGNRSYPSIDCYASCMHARVARDMEPLMFLLNTILREKRDSCSNSYVQ